MPSPFTMAARTVIVLGCLLVLPLLAMIGPSLPKPIRSGVKSATGSSEQAKTSKAANSRPTAPKVQGGRRAVQSDEETSERASPGSPISRADFNDASGAAARNDRGGAPHEHSTAPTFDELFHELQDLEVADFKLESWGARGELYRCNCQASSSPKGGHARHFEATADNPSKALAKIVADVRQWRTSLAAKTGAPATGSGSHGAAKRRIRR